MFYVKDLTGTLSPYSSGSLRTSRRVEGVHSSQPTDPIGGSQTSGVTDSRLQHRPTRDNERSSAGAWASFNAYQRAMDPETPRRRVMYASEMMHAPVFTISDSVTLAEAARIFKERRFRHIPVIDSAGTLVGILSDRDLLKRAASQVADGSSWQKELVRAVMSNPVLVASPDTEIREVARVMFTERVGCIPLLDEKQHVVGIITRSDILRTLLIQAPLELWT